MICEVTVVSSRSPDAFVNHLATGLQWIREQGFTVEVQTSSRDSRHHTTVALKGKSRVKYIGEDDIEYIFKHQLAETLAENIIDQWECELMLKEVGRRFKGFSHEEQVRILRKARDFLGENLDSDLALIMRWGRKGRIVDRLFEYLYTKGNNLLILDGFITFYVSDYLKELRIALDIASEEIKKEQEYQEFVRLLKYFVDSEPPKKVEVNVLVKPGGMFEIWDQDGQPIDSAYMEYYWDDLIANDITLDDVLISVLISLAPRKLIIHNLAERTAENEPVSLLCQVFDGRISHCAGCEKCWQTLVTRQR